MHSQTIKEISRFRIEDSFYPPSTKTYSQCSGPQRTTSTKASFTATVLGALSI
jgi:hypothetical protein